MTELIKITENNGNRAVSARDLHMFLDSKQDFTNWIKARVAKYDLIEGVDFVFELWDMKLNKIIEPVNQLVTGSYKTEFILSIDSAKELSMVEGNSKGKEARRYFIECEKKLTSNVAIPKSFSAALQLAADQAKALELAAPKVEYHDKVLSTNNSFTPSQLGSEFGMSAIKFNNHLKSMGVLRMVGKEWLLTAKYLGNDYTHRSTFMYSDNKTTHALKWTEKGRKFIHELLK